MSEYANDSQSCRFSSNSAVFADSAFEVDSHEPELPVRVFKFSPRHFDGPLPSPLFADVTGDFRSAHNSSFRILNRRNGHRKIDQTPVLPHSHRFKMIDAVAARILARISVSSAIRSGGKSIQIGRPTASAAV